MIAQASLPSLVTPGAGDLIGLLPELVLSAAFVLLMVFDVFLPSTRRSWLAVFAFTALAAAFGLSMWGWFDSGQGRTLYFGAFAYDRFSMFVNAILLISAGLVVLISPQYLNRRGIHYGEYYALILSATTGMMFLAGAMNLMVIFLGIELLSISLYVLSGFSRNEERSPSRSSWIQSEGKCTQVQPPRCRTWASIFAHNSSTSSTTPKQAIC